MKYLFQSPTVQEHMQATSSDNVRGALLLKVLNEPALDGLDVADKFLHLYLNECFCTKDQAWYEQMHRDFVAHRSHWASRFEHVLAMRKATGSKNQKNNALGDWLALGQLQGTPLAFEMLSHNNRNRARIPVQNGPPMISVSMAKVDRYKHVFALMHAKHHGESPYWQAGIA